MGRLTPERLFFILSRLAGAVHGRFFHLSAIRKNHNPVNPGIILYWFLKKDTRHWKKAPEFVLSLLQKTNNEGTKNISPAHRDFWT
jgi:hypothetical protein